MLFMYSTVVEHQLSCVFSHSDNKHFSEDSPSLKRGLACASVRTAS